MNVRIDGGVGDYDRSGLDPAQTLLLPRRGLYGRVFKRVLDVVLVLLAVPVVLLLVAFLAALIARDGHSPFYRQQRLGRGGREFTLWKLRSMVPETDARLAAHLASDEAARREWDTYQKLTCDPRVTAFGRMLRKSSLDELPQLWNVLKGDMSLVGPRPMLPEQLPLYPGRAYFALRPGVTGLWQVSDRNASTFAQRAEFDADYAHSLSLATDLRVLAATVSVVVRGTGR